MYLPERRYEVWRSCWIKIPAWSQNRKSLCATQIFPSVCSTRNSVKHLSSASVQFGNSLVLRDCSLSASTLLNSLFRGRSLWIPRAVLYLQALGVSSRWISHTATVSSPIVRSSGVPFGVISLSGDSCSSLWRLWRRPDCEALGLLFRFVHLSE